MMTSSGTSCPASIKALAFRPVGVPFFTAARRSRRVCPDCGASYHVAAVPPKAEGVCDKCGGKLIQRKGDGGNVQLFTQDVGLCSLSGARGAQQDQFHG